MFPSTIEIIKSAFKVDPSLTPSDRIKLLALIRHGEDANRRECSSPSGIRILRRAEVARRLSCSLRMVDKLASNGLLQKRKLPGRTRACGILEADVETLILCSPPPPEKLV